MKKIVIKNRIKSLTEDREEYQKEYDRMKARLKKEREINEDERDFSYIAYLENRKIIYLNKINTSDRKIKELEELI